MRYQKTVKKSLFPPTMRHCEDCTRPKVSICLVFTQIDHFVRIISFIHTEHARARLSFHNHPGAGQKIGNGCTQRDRERGEKGHKIVKGLLHPSINFESQSIYWPWAKNKNKLSSTCTSHLWSPDQSLSFSLISAAVLCCSLCPRADEMCSGVVFY